MSMRRREFITLIGGAAATWPVAARAQQAERTRRIGVLMGIAESDPQARIRVSMLRDGLQKLGWIDGRNVRIDLRWCAGDTECYRKYAEELVASGSEVILTTTNPALLAVQQASGTVPIVFVGITDPVGGGFVASLARPGGNTTGFTLFEYSIGAKWLELLRDLTPSVKRVAVIRDSAITSGSGQLGAIQSVASFLGMEVTPVDVHDAGAIEHDIAAFAGESKGGLIVTASALAAVHRDLVITMAARYRLPAVFPFRYFVTSGGLISYGPDIADQYQRSTDYVDRILRGEKPAVLPVQAPTKYELAINMKTAKALGINVPATLLARAYEVIE
jgi:putative tryptophan/tyrosine transport system substrate-binding protein